MTIIFRTAFICAVVLGGLTGCANPPTSLGKVPARVNIVEQYGNSTAYSVADKFSFLQAEVEYPATAGHHRINVGDFILGEVLRAIVGKDIKNIRLVSFKSQCNNGGGFMPHAICKTDWTIALSLKGVDKLITSSIPNVDIGNIRVRQDQFMFIPIVNGDDFFQGQIGPLLKLISEDVASKLAAGISD